MFDYHSFSFSVIGANHLKHGMPMQDYAINYHSENMAFAAVADGHGDRDCFRSDRGARFAAECAKDCITGFIQTAAEKNICNKYHGDELFKQLSKSIISDWYKKVWSDCNEDSFKESELVNVSNKYRKKYMEKERMENAYGCTLIAAAITEKYWFGLQIGDGKCVAMCEDLSFVQPIPWDSKCFLNETTSICDENAFNEFRYYTGSSLPIAVFLGTDGIDDSFQNDSQLYDMYERIVLNIFENGIYGGEDSLREFLPELTKRGSGDDVSIAGLIHMPLLNSKISSKMRKNGDACVL